MRKYLLFFCAILLSSLGRANDGVFYTSGNQLIPITETEISVKKEILSITREDNKMLVHVY